ncbi:MAG TPA: CrcB family protein [Streptosporangiaceae bacterium]|nr:CrcB family protein [Streptosporangiaceae bacterium]
MRAIGDPERLRPAAPQARRPRPRRQPVPWLTLAVIAAGGVIGALARLGIETAFPHRAGGFDWATLAINVTGCALIGALMVILTEARQVHRLAGPFLGTGVLGGFTTFSSYIVDAQQSLTHGAPLTALACLALTLAGGLAAGYTAVTLTRRIARPHHKERS